MKLRDGGASFIIAWTRGTGMRSRISLTSVFFHLHANMDEHTHVLGQASSGMPREHANTFQCLYSRNEQRQSQS